MGYVPPGPGYERETAIGFGVVAVLFVGLLVLMAVAVWRVSVVY